jgi:sterol desaturase/sphingolipid hydroxylase (fatty acid hydroxylase superfamily)
MRGQIIRRLVGAILDAIVQMSRTPANYWAEFVLDIPAGVVLIFEGLRHHDTNPDAVFLTFLLGLLFFSFCEYFFHRWLFHGSLLPLMAEGHHAHHVNPLGYDALPFFLPVMLLLSLTGVFGLLMPARYAFVLSGAMAFGYVTYGLSHFCIHHTRFRNHLARRWAANHHIHHYHPDSNFGVTTPLWDILLGTRYLWHPKSI